MGIEFFVRMFLVLFFGFIASGKKVLFEVFSVELGVQGLGLQVSESLINGLMLLALIVAVLYQWRFARPARRTS